MERKGEISIVKKQQIQRTEEINAFSFPNICTGKISRVLGKTCAVD